MSALFVARHAKPIPIFHVTTLYCHRKRRPHWPAKNRSLAKSARAFMRVAGVAAGVFSFIVDLAIADNASASIRKPTHISAQRLGPALVQLAQSRGLQVLYLSNTVRDLRTLGADGDITAEEAFNQLLTGTGLTYRYLDENTVTIVPLSAPALPEGGGVSLQKPQIDSIALAEVVNVPADRFVLAQATAAPASQSTAPPTEPQPLQEIIVTGS